MLKTIIHHYHHYQGTIRWAGKNLKQIHHKSFAQNVAVINQNYNLTKYPIKVYDFVAFGRIPYLKMLSSLSADDHQIIRQVLSQVKISDLADKLVTQLSGGQKQKVLIAMALAQTTDTIILDEPTTFLDLKNQYELLEMLKQLNHQKKTIIAVLHDLNQAITYSDQLILMKDGQIYDYGPPKEVINNDSLNAVFNYQGKLVKTGKQVFLSNIV